MDIFAGNCSYCHIPPAGGSTIHHFTSSRGPSVFITVCWTQDILFGVGLPDLEKTKTMCLFRCKLKVSKESFSKSISQMLLHSFYLATLFLGGAEGGCGWEMGRDCLLHASEYRTFCVNLIKGDTITLVHRFGKRGSERLLVTK